MSQADKTRFKLTNGYSIDFDKIARLLHFVCQNSCEHYSQAEITETLGLPEAHSQTITRLAETMGLLKPGTSVPTHFGRLVRTNDPFFDDVGTVWFCHYIGASNPQNIVWNRLVNHVIPQFMCFTLAQVSDSLECYQSRFSEVFFRRFVAKEPKYLVKAYLDENFANLAFLRQDGEQFSLSYRESIPPLVLAACIVRYRDQHRPGDTALSITDLLSAPNSPGVVCQIPEDRLRAGLEALKTQPGFSLESRADLDQVRLTDNTQDYQWMERYYEGRG